MKGFVRGIASVWMVAAALCAGPALAKEGPNPVTPGTDWMPLAPAQLDGLRGGYRLPSGLQVSFGFERVVHVNGRLVSSLRVHVADVGRITPQEAAQLAALGQVQLVRIGAGNTMQAQMAGLVIQNTLDNQSIQVRTTLDVGVGTLGMWQALNAGEALQRASLSAVGGP
ncbi:hypothetical protein [Luteimonas saliphila]|uniref:hypothetical protein n=1 Tax=Luteimonas saliphila TaxID=2804919 RepID=UPI00192DE629|nr:hypothetical protein [Luteimonas saliphila]